MARRLFSATMLMSSSEPKPQLSEANKPSLTPPLLVKKPCRIGASSLRAETVIMGEFSCQPFGFLDS